MFDMDRRYKCGPNLCRRPQGRPYGFPNIALLLVGNEENGEAEAWGTPHVLKEMNLIPSLFIAGERTGEKGNELFGEICIENRGVMRFDVIARGAKGHSGIAAHFFCNLKCCFSSNIAVDTAVLQRDGAFDNCDVLAFLILDHILEGFFSLLACARHDSLMVLKGDNIQDNLRDGRLGGAKH